MLWCGILMLCAVIQSAEIRGKRKVVPVSNVKACTGIMQEVVFISSVGARWKSMVQLSTWPLGQGEKPPAPLN
jgi:TRAP-type uncharacterized transport system fused permease subunit